MRDTSTPPLTQPQPFRPTLPWLTLVVMIALTVVTLRGLGRTWWCSGGDPNGEPLLWSGDVWSMHNSQHLVDPYSFTHVSHGLIFALLFLLIPQTRRLSFAWRMIPAVAIEMAWEIVENTSLVIDRYRESTMALGYNGDSIGNSLGDIGCFMIGIAYANGLKWYWSVALFLTTEVILLLTIRDNLILNVFMLLYPIDAVKHWQMAGI